MIKSRKSWHFVSPVSPTVVVVTGDISSHFFSHPGGRLQTSWFCSDRAAEATICSVPTPSPESGDFDGNCGLHSDGVHYSPPYPLNAGIPLTGFLFCLPWYLYCRRVRSSQSDEVRYSWLSVSPTAGTVSCNHDLIIHVFNSLLP